MKRYSTDILSYTSSKVTYLLYRGFKIKYPYCISTVRMLVALVALVAFFVDALLKRQAAKRLALHQRVLVKLAMFVRSQMPVQVATHTPKEL